VVAVVSIAEFWPVENIRPDPNTRRDRWFWLMERALNAIGRADLATVESLVSIEGLPFVGMLCTPPIDLSPAGIDGVEDTASDSAVLELGP